MPTKVAIGCFSTSKDGRPQDPFIPAFAKTFLVIHSFKGNYVEGSIRNVRTDEHGVSIGAVSYPYSGAGRTNDPRASKEVPLTKNLSVCFKYVVDDDGTRRAVRWQSSAFAYVDEDDNFYPESRVGRLYFNSELLADYEKAKARGENPNEIPKYIEWMRNQGNSPARVLDVGVPTGRRLHEFLENVYFSGRTPISQLEMPEFYIATRERPAVDEARLNAEIIRLINSNIPEIPGEFYSKPVVITGITTDNEHKTHNIDICGVVQSVDSTGRLYWTCTNEVRTLMFPMGKKTANGTTTKIFNTNLVLENAEQGMVVDPGFVINPFNRLVQVVPTINKYETLEDLAEMIGDKATSWVQAEIMNRLCPEIRGLRAPSLRLLSALPRNFDASQIMTSSAPFVRLMLLKDLEKELVSKTNPLYSGVTGLNFNLIHHSRYEQQLENVRKRQEEAELNRTRRREEAHSRYQRRFDKPSGLGDAAAAAMQQHSVQLINLPQSTETKAPITESQPVGVDQGNSSEADDQP